jgi:hypothetical protein
MSMRLVPLAPDWNNFAARDDRSFVLPGTAAMSRPMLN